jgi:stringent starvation protein B
MMDAPQATSTRPYLIRALYEWCTDNGYTPYIAVVVNERVQVPREYVKDGEIVLNIGFDATTSLQLGNDFIEFKARFAGTARDILVPVAQVVAIYARENGQGMAFPMAIAEAAEVGTLPHGAASATSELKSVPLTSVAAPHGNDRSGDEPEPPRPPPPGSRPTLTRVK